MDGFIKSGNSLETLIHTITSVTNTLSQYGFKLHKWISNNEYLLNKFTESEKASTNKAKILEIIGTQKVVTLVYVKSINPLYLPNEECLVYYVQFTIHSVLQHDVF